MRALIFLLVLAGCTAGHSRIDNEESLARDLGGRAEGPAESCVPAESGRSLVVADRRTLTYDRGDTVWVNRLDAACPGFAPMSTLIIEAHGGRYCRGDRVRALEPGAGIPGPYCILRDFTPYRRRD